MTLPALASQMPVRFDPNARTYAAYSFGGGTTLQGSLEATTLETACAEATERWHWDRGGRIGIREIGQEDSKHWPFDKIPLDRLHIYAVRRSAPIAWKPTADLMRTVPVYRYKLELICAVDLTEFNEPNQRRAKHGNVSGVE